MKMQIAFRRLIGQKFDGKDVAAAVGLLDSPGTSESYDECLESFHLPMNDNGSEPTSASALHKPHLLSSIADCDTLNSMRYANLEDIIKMRIPRPRPSDTSNAHLFFRKTRVVSHYKDGTVFAFAGTVCVNNVINLDCRDVLQFGSSPRSSSPAHMQFEGRLGRTIRQDFSQNDLTSELQGQPISQFLLHPKWGFGDQPIALGSTLSLDTQSLHEEYTSLFFVENKTMAQDQQYRHLRTRVKQAGFTLLDEDPVLARVLERIRDSEDYVSPFSPKTRDEFKAANNALSAAFEAIAQGEDDAYFKEWRRRQDEIEETAKLTGYN